MSAKRSGDEVNCLLKGLDEPAAPKPPKRLRSKPKRTPSELTRNVQILMDQAQGCQACDLIAAFVPGWECGLYPLDPHHRRRQGKGDAKGGGHMLTNLRAVCRLGHDWIHNIKNQELARSLGLLVLPGDSEFEALALRRLGEEN